MQKQLVIRWLELFSSWEREMGESAKLEMTLGRDVCAECLYGLRTYYQSRLGLLVNTDKTKLVRGYDHDVSSWGNSDGGVDVHELEECVPYETTWRGVFNLVRANGERQGSGECIIRDPVYSAVIVIADYANKPVWWNVEQTTIEKARIVSSVMGIPIYVSHAIEYNYEVQTRDGSGIWEVLGKDTCNKAEWTALNKKPHLTKELRKHW